MCIYIYSFCKVPPSYKLICKPHEYEFVISTINPNVSCSPTFSSKDITSKTSSFLDSTIIFHHLKPRGFPMVSSVFRHVSHPFFHGPKRTFHRFEAGSSSMVCSGEQSKTVESRAPGAPGSSWQQRGNVSMATLKTAHELIGYIVIYIYIYYIE